MKKNSDPGFITFKNILIILVVILVVLSYLFFNEKSDRYDLKNGNQNSTLETKQSNKLLWQQSENGWSSIDKVPDCPTSPILKSPVDLSLATSVLYPGQTRGGDYKTHGGFRFDNSKDNSITVTAPLDGYVVSMASYLESDELQYMFEIMNNCGVLYRLDHLRVLSKKFENIAKDLPTPKSNDSRTTRVNPPVFVKQGEVIATKIGYVIGTNVFLDWGVYDYRKPNDVSRNYSFQKAHKDDKSLSWYAVCWFDWVSQNDEELIRQLPPGDLRSNNASDYCK